MLNKVEFFFVGPGKTGTSWLYSFIERHGLASVPRLKEPHIVDVSSEEAARRVALLYSHHERMCDFSNTYSGDPSNPDRILAYNRDAKVFITTRLPSERVMSHYRFHVARNAGSAPSLEEYLAAGDEARIIERSDYRRILNRYLEVMDPARILVLPLEQLRYAPSDYVARLTQHLDAPPVTLNEEDLLPVMVQSRARVPVLGRLAVRSSSALRRHGMVRMLGYLKRSQFLREMIYGSSCRPAEEFGSLGGVVGELDADYADYVLEVSGFDLREAVGGDP